MTVRFFVREFPAIHLAIGVIGNVIFFVGSVLFIWHTTETLAIWLFIIGSFGMMLGAIGQAFYTWERHRLNGAPGARPQEPSRAAG
ncbi:YrhK-like protein [Amycolatopsis pretoriensis]|uniref:YrhK-like protein n=1 Tax=Amycolatopsis pretoriensis TaxID=218821 RepID=A0A1H5RGD7_9PSEU|nr:YrhK family protein [Amycolatopsis pretoriensis]SEF37390.1 YrhK-like protein [Amycolatopsis pretoriensis]